MSFVSLRPPINATLMVEGKQNSLFPEGTVIKCFIIPSNPQIEKLQENILLNGYGAMPAVRVAVR